MVPVDPATVLSIIALAERLMGLAKQSGEVSDDEIDAAKAAGVASDDAYDEYMAELRRRREAGDR